MFDIGLSELLLTTLMAVLLFGPKDLPLVMRHAGRLTAKITRTTQQWRTSFLEAADRIEQDAALEHLEKAASRALNRADDRHLAAVQGKPARRIKKSPTKSRVKK